MQTASQLQQLLARIDRKSYSAYKETRGIYQFRDYVLSIDYVQGDPFAAPSRVSIHVKGKRGGFPPALYAQNCRRIAIQDAITRLFGKHSSRITGVVKGSGHSGVISVSRCGQQVLERTACGIDPTNGDMVLRLEIGFPANGRTINAHQLSKILFELLPECVEYSLFYENLDGKWLQSVAELAEDQEYIRQTLPQIGLCAFVADGSILPRASGVSDQPMKGSVPFCAPRELAVTLNLPNRGKVTGMGIPQGITLIVGGGYHGKSTLLKALQLGVYNHIAGDGREYVITDNTAVKVRAEDGRSIASTDISMFISGLPNGKNTTCFVTEDASGSTSQAANVVEAMEAGARVLLMDEDTSATNFMVRDELMQRVIHRDKEPITPFVERVVELYHRHGISTILVAGSSGAYFHIAHHIIQMDCYVPRDITTLAKQEAQGCALQLSGLAPAPGPKFSRFIRPSNDYGRSERIKIKTLGRDGVSINGESIDLRYVEQLTDTEQLTALAHCLVYAYRHIVNGEKSVRQVVEELEQVMENHGLEALVRPHSGVTSMARPRAQEIFACLNRFRSLSITEKE